MTIITKTKPLSLLSSKDIPSQERLIFALDVPSIEKAKKLVNDLGDTICFYKIGLELFMSGNYLDFISWLKAKDKKVFVDLRSEERRVGKEC